MKQKKSLYEKYKHGIPAIIYSIIYLSWFNWLEKNVTNDYTLIHTSLDDYIPFCEFFVVPYILWFAYVAVVLLAMFFTDVEDFKKLCIFLSTGMTLFLIISTLWPNGHHLRPIFIENDNIFTQMVRKLYTTDSSKNLWPSIHVYNSLACHFAVIHSKKFSKNMPVRIASLVLAVSIILSTMFIKQHSVFDVMTALALGAIMYLVVYGQEIREQLKNSRLFNKKKANPQIG